MALCDGISRTAAFVSDAGKPARGRLNYAERPRALEKAVEGPEGAGTQEAQDEPGAAGLDGIEDEHQGDGGEAEQGSIPSSLQLTERAMRIVDHARQGREEWRSGVLARMRVSALNGSVQFCIFEQRCDRGRGAPTPLHVVEEVPTVLDGRAEVWLGEERATLTAGQSVVVPAFEVASEDLRETKRCWLPNPSQN